MHAGFALATVTQAQYYSRLRCVVHNMRLISFLTNFTRDLRSLADSALFPPITKLFYGGPHATSTRYIGHVDDKMVTAVAL